MKLYRNSHCRETVVSTVTRLWTGWSEVRIPVGVRDLSRTKNPNRHLGPTRLQWTLPGSKAVRAWRWQLISI